MKILILILCSVLTFGCTSTNSDKSEYVYSTNLNYKQMVKLHYQQSKTKIGFQYEAYQLIPEHNKYWSPIAKKCRKLTEDEGNQSFEFVFAVNKDGNVIDAKSELESNGVKCFLNGIKGIKYPKPPYETWYEVVRVK
ncbi:hypothetical protein N7931_14155 [Catenovulum sp. 2E275]|uniref:hypothetical protein n=1 Tax=Catenovulum sp. 2E275 TaxID=2980497 RepID=UPI0021D35740|nr:hypothetical protein [Catenovulum sp. 2E275]MCU4676772.1 hypothetical protein [Catenovulum sp. 2E275]